MKDSAQFFLNRFPRLTKHGQAPYAWQTELYGRFVAGDFPERLDLPTGLGKTSVMHVWLLALAWRAGQDPSALGIPRRLVWVVDRRVVVDQATTEAEELERRVRADPELAAMLAALSDDAERPLALSTLRGERADNREWSDDPARPAIVVGTVDMIGSRLLFSGYGVRRQFRPVHAGLLANDVLLVNDEAHLTPAFARLISKSLKGFTGQQTPFRTMRLSATAGPDDGTAFQPDWEADLQNEGFRRRYQAEKRLSVEPADHVRKRLAALAVESSGRTLVFVRRPEDARTIAKDIEKKHKGARVPLLTGLQRGFERDWLLEDEVVLRFLSKEPPAPDAPPCWLVATSAGEVGIDLSSDRLLSDLDTADHILQRLGRLNRAGETTGEATVVYREKDLQGDKEPAPRLRATVEYLRSLDNASPEALLKAPPPEAALQPAPPIAPLRPWHVDAWSLTSIAERDWPSRPAVAAWLHGGQEAAPPETYVCWREDAEDLADEAVSERDRDAVLAFYRVRAAERLKQYTGDLVGDLRKRRDRFERRALLVESDGSVRAGTVEQLIERHEAAFAFATLILPPGFGVLDGNGMVDWSLPGRAPGEMAAEELAHYDRSATETRRRVRAPAGESPSRTDAEGWRLRAWFQSGAEDESEGSAGWAYYQAPPSGKKELVEISLDDHLGHVATVARRLAQRLGWSDERARVFEAAARTHDLGKKRRIWQDAAGKRNGEPPTAKPKWLNGRALGGYRHELGSLVEVARNRGALDGLNEGERELAHHLVATHHGWGRPHFPERGLDKEAVRRSRDEARESARRFGRLQRRYGAYGLAYLEAVFRCADAIASRKAPEADDDQ